MGDVRLDDMPLEKVGSWAGLWNRHWAGAWCLRSHSPEFYRRRYFANPYGHAYLLTDAEGREVGYCGVQRRAISYRGRTYTLAEISDLIVDDAFRDTGLFAPAIRRLISLESEHSDGCVFAPINRRAYLALRLLIPEHKQFRLDNWALAWSPGCPSGGIETERFDDVTRFLGTLDMKTDAEHLAYAVDPGYLEWRYSESAEYRFVSAYSRGDTRGFMIYRQIEGNGHTIAEVSDIYSDLAPRQLTQFIESALSHIGGGEVECVTLKLPAGNRIGEALPGSIDMRLLGQTHVMMFGPISAISQECDCSDNHLSIGESWDVPRSGTVLTGMLTEV